MMDVMKRERIEGDRLHLALQDVQQLSLQGKKVLLVSDMIPEIELIDRYKAQIDPEIPDNVGWVTDINLESISRYIKRFNPDVVLLHFLDPVDKKLDLGDREFRTYYFYSGDTQ